MAERFAPLLSSGDTELKNQASTDAMKKVTRREEEEFKPTVAGRIAAPLLDIVEKALVWAFVDKSQPNYYLSGNYAPVEETKPVSNLPVIGSLPECLNGEFMRVGPNPRFNPVGGYHWFDGDGMIHAVWIKDGKATYVSRYVKTNRLKQETYYGAAKFGKFGDVMGGKFGLLFALLSSLRVKLGVLDVSRGAGQGNTALTFHNGTLLALHEADKPYALRVLEDGDLETQGLMDYDSRLDHRFTAHPKLDPVTGELFTFGYDVEKPPPNVTYRVISKDGVLADPVHITIPEPVMMHDFAITENFAIFMDLPLIFRPKEILKSGNPFIFDSTKKARFGILPRYSRNEGQIRWFEVPSCFIFHNLNAWEEGDEIVLYTCRMESMDLKLIAVHNSDGVNNMMTELYEFRFNLKSGRASQRKLGDFFADFPRINEDYVGRKQRYGYVCVFENLKIKGVVKVDLFAEPQLGKGLAVGNNITGVFLHGNKRYGSEAVFVPSNNASAEDDGYLITFVHDENLERSEVVVIDAKTMSADPVAVVLLPSRVPYGFHANFVSEYQIKSQKRW